MILFKHTNKCCLLIIILLFLLNGSTGRCQENQFAGISAFQILSKHWTTKQCGKLIFGLKNFPYPAVSVLWGSFGNDFACLKRIIKVAEKSKTLWWIQIHLSNEAGRRNRRLTNLDLLPNLSVVRYNRKLEQDSLRVKKAIVSRVKEIKKLTRKTKNIVWNISLGLESNFTKKAARKIYKIIRYEWPHQISIANIPSMHIRGASIELHGYQSTDILQERNNCIRNGDGTGISDLESHFSGRVNYPMSEVRRWVKRCKKSSCVCLLWSFRWQGITKQYFVEPDKRSFIFGSKDIDIINRITGGLL